MSSHLTRYDSSKGCVCVFDFRGSVGSCGSCGHRFLDGSYCSSAVHVA
jgi:hypothetical protein